jgi:hypothetical protein
MGFRGMRTSRPLHGVVSEPSDYGFLGIASSTLQHEEDLTIRIL